MRFEMAGKFKTKQASLLWGSVYNGRKAHIYGAQRTNATLGHAQMPPSVIKPTYAAQNSRARWQSRNWIVHYVTRDRNEIKARKIIDKHAQKVKNYVYTKWQAETLRGHSVGAADSCVGSLSTASHMVFRRVALSTRQLPGGLKSCQTCGIRLIKASFSATVLHSACKR